MKSLRPGACVIFSVTRHSTHPDPRASDVHPDPHGEGYTYAVDKFWVVTDEHDGRIAVKTRRGKVHVIDANDPRLQVASWWQRMIHRSRFPKMRPID